jgi:acyl-CoA hydrolase
MSANVFVEVERWFVMKRFFVVTIAACALLVPTLTLAQVRTVYIPGAHPRVVVVQPDNETPTAKVEKAPLTPAQVIARHEPMANGHRTANRVNHSAVAHCDRLVAQARAELRKGF